MRILFLSRWYPYPADNGSRLRIYHLLKALALGHDVELISFSPEPVTEQRIEAMRPFCCRIEVVPYRHYRTRPTRAFLGFFARHPRSVVAGHDSEMQRRVEEAGARGLVDIVIASQVDMAPYALCVPANLRVLEEIELAVLYEAFTFARHPVKRLRRALAWQKWAWYVAELMQTFDVCTVASLAERELATALAPLARCPVVIPNGADIDGYAGIRNAPERDTLIYAGSLTYQANLDAMNFFIREIFPLVLAKRPDVTLTITGKLDGIPPERLPAGRAVHYSGYLEDVRPAIARSWASIVPLRQGGGTRLKILESLALGTPVVASSKGAEGLDLIPGQDLLIEDTPKGFAGTILNLLGDPCLRERLSRSGRQAVSQYDWQIIGTQFRELLENASAQVRDCAMENQIPWQ